MMKKVLLVKNDESGNKVKVSNVAITDDTNELIYFVPTIPGRRPTSRWFGQKPFVDLGTTYMFEGYEYSLIALAKGWEIASTTGGERKKREPKAKEAKRETKREEETKIDEEFQAALKIAAILRSGKGGTATVDESKVREIVEAYIADLCKEDEGRAKIKTIKRAKESKEAKKCKNYESILRDIQDGYNVYLYGPAGSGKSHTAEQIASDLGLKFYGQTTIQFAHDVRGYGDAAGNFVPTPFFFAFRDGGLYFQDEYDRSCAEAAIVLNTALANGYYDFPVVGRVEAHENFRFMAAGNTTMTGADEQYVTGQIIDASSRDRFASMYEIGYDHDVELSIAHGDTETVEFVEDVRHAIAESGIQHVVSYRATAYMINRKEDRKATLLRGVFKGLQMDEIRIIASKLQTMGNGWTKEARRLA